MHTLDAWEEFEKRGFFARMRTRLRKAEPKNPEPHLKNYSWGDFVAHLEEEINELKKAMKEGDNFERCNELADVANMCAFVFCKIHQLNE